MQELLEFYRENDYVVVPDALSTDEVRTINEIIDRDLVENPAMWFEREDGHYQLNVHLLITHPEIDFTMRPPRLLPLLEAIMGPIYVQRNIRYGFVVPILMGPSVAAGTAMSVVERVKSPIPPRIPPLSFT